MARAMTGLVARHLPSLAILAVTLTGALPWGLSAGGGSSMPPASLGAVLPIAVIHACGYWRPSITPAWIGFVAGLVTDTVTGGPLGYWPLLYLLALKISRVCEFHVPSAHMAMGWATFVVAAVILAICGWAVASLYHVQIASWWVLGRPLAVAAGLFPVLAVVLLAALRWAETGRIVQRPASE